MTQNSRVDWGSVAVLVLVGVVVAVECALFGPLPTSRASIEQQIITVEELQSALRSDRLILHVDVDWSPTAVHARPTVLQFKSTLAQDPQLSDVRFRRVDVTDQGGELCEALKQWMNDQSADRSVLSGGGGAVVWARNGRVVASVGCATYEGLTRLVDVTYDVFQVERPFASKR